MRITENLEFSEIHGRGNYMRRSSIGAMVAALAVILPVAACGAEKAAEQDGQTTVRLMGDFPVPWVPQIPWIYAMQKGWYSDQGLNVEYQLPQGTTSPANVVGTGKVDLAIVYTSDLMTAEDNDLNLKALMSVGEKLPGGICALEGSGVTTPKDLEGKTASLMNNPHSKANWERFAQLNGIDASKVNTVDAGSDPTPLLISGAVDVAIDAAETQECIKASLATGKPYTMLSFTDAYNFPRTYFLEVAANGDWLEQHEEAARKFVAVTQKAIQHCEANQQECLDVYINSDPDAIDPELARLGFEAQTSNYWCGNSNSCWYPEKPIGWIDSELWLESAQFLKDNDLIAGDPQNALKVLTDNKYLDPSILPAP